MTNEFNEYVRECFSEAGEIAIKSMMGGSSWNLANSQNHLKYHKTLFL